MIRQSSVRGLLNASGRLRRQWHFEKEIASWLCGFGSGCYRALVGLHHRPDVGTKHDQREFSVGKILLIPDILVGGNHHIETCRFGRPQKLTVLELRMPRHLDEGVYFVIRKKTTPTGTFLSNAMRNAMTSCVRQNGVNRVCGKLKLFRDFGHAYAVVKIIDNGLDRHPGSAQNGSAALDVLLDLDQRAFRPINSFLSRQKGSPLR
jgi:hypothetical protein